MSVRINQFIAQATGLSRRGADQTIADKRVRINNHTAQIGQTVTDADVVYFDGQTVTLAADKTTIMLNKPSGYICSREGQGGKTIYELLPKQYGHLKPVGRLDKDSSGLLLLTNDGQLAHELTHPRFAKTKVYEVRLDHDLTEADFQTITHTGVPLEDGSSKFALDFINDQNRDWRITMTEGRNRQIRRTFAALGYRIIKLHRTHFGPYELKNLRLGGHTSIQPQPNRR